MLISVIVRLIVWDERVWECGNFESIYIGILNGVEGVVVIVLKFCLDNLIFVNWSVFFFGVFWYG